MPLYNNLLISAETNEADAELLERVIGRADRLWEDGYTWQAGTEGSRCFIVWNKKREAYVVGPVKNSEQEERKLPPSAFWCSCPFWPDNSVCKHSIAIRAIVALQEAEEAAQIAEYEAHQAMIDAAENAEFGCDPYPEF